MVSEISKIIQDEPNVRFNIETTDLSRYEQIVLISFDIFKMKHMIMWDIHQKYSNSCNKL